MKINNSTSQSKWQNQVVGSTTEWASVVFTAAEDKGKGEKKKPVGVEECLGYALGCVGLSYDDFCRLTPSEFGAVCKAYGERAESSEQGDWERMRTLACVTIQPHIKKRMTPRQLMPFPWDGKHKDGAPQMSHEERMKRAREALKRFG